VFDKCKFDLLLGFDRPIILELVAKHYGAYYLTLGVSRFGDRYMWFENNFEEKGLYVDLVKKYLNDYKKGPERIDYEPYKRYSYTANMLDYSYKNAFKLAFKQFIHEIYAHVRRIHKRDSYILFGWIPAILRNSHNYRYYAKNSVRPSDIKRYRLVYFPLNQEPESALLFLSPEFNNSMEIIAWVSKSLPADTLLVIKENPWSFGIRSKRFYKTLLM
jgi:hypothetical protein